jgi:hypothetical protein
VLCRERGSRVRRACSRVDPRHEREASRWYRRLISPSAPRPSNSPRSLRPDIRGSRSNGSSRLRRPATRTLASPRSSPSWSTGTHGLVCLVATKPWDRECRRAWRRVWERVREIRETLRGHVKHLLAELGLARTPSGTTRGRGIIYCLVFATGFWLKYRQLRAPRGPRLGPPGGYLDSGRPSSVDRPTADLGGTVAWRRARRRSNLEPGWGQSI